MSIDIIIKHLAAQNEYMSQINDNLEAVAFEIEQIKLSLNEERNV